VTGKVLKVEPLENRDGLFEHRVQFLKISDSEREDIIHYIFEEERKIRKKQD
jgi:c-di-GMP-binding flagellar brake protein YcgR